MNVGAAIERLTTIRAIVIGFFLASVYYFFMFDSGTAQVSQIAAAKEDTTKAEAEVKVADQKLQKAHEYQRSAADMGEALNRLLAYIPEDFRQPEFRKTIAEEAKAAGLSINNIQDGQGSNQASKHAEFEEMVVTADLGGAFAQHLTFLSNLTKQKQIFTIEKFALERDSGSTDETIQTKFLLEVKAYRYVGSKTKQ